MSTMKLECLEHFPCQTTIHLLLARYMQYVTFTFAAVLNQAKLSSFQPPFSTLGVTVTHMTK